MFGVDVTVIKFLVQNQKYWVWEINERHQQTDIQPEAGPRPTLLYERFDPLSRRPRELHKVAVRQLDKLILVNIQNFRDVLEQKKEV